MAEIREVPEQFIQELNNKNYVLFDGLLALAHEDGVSEMDAEILMGPSEKNNHSWIVKAKVVTSKGTFFGIGDANDNNVNRNIAKHVIRMAETRATARALRKAVNVGMTALEELGGDDAPPAQQRSGGGQQRSGGGQRSGGAQRGGARNAQQRSPDLITKADAGRLRHMLGELGANVEGFEDKNGPIEEMSKARGERWLESVAKRLEEANQGTQDPEPASTEEDIDLNEADFEDIPF